MRLHRERSVASPSLSRPGTRCAESWNERYTHHEHAIQTIALDQAVLPVAASRTAVDRDRVAFLLITSIYSSGAIGIFFRPRDGGAERMLQAGRIIDQITEDNDLAIVVDDYGIMSPILLYFAHLKGWSFEPTDVSPAAIDNLHQLGARYFITTRWSEVQSEKPEAAAFLEMYQDIPIGGAPAGTRIVDLRQRK